MTVSLIILLLINTTTSEYLFFSIMYHKYYILPKIFVFVLVINKILNAIIINFICKIGKYNS
jgi:hypothetical protein